MEKTEKKGIKIKEIKGNKSERGRVDMDKIVWNDRLNIGVEVVDKAHANLFRVVGKLIHLVENEANYKNACKEGIRYLEDYTVKHFSEEEAYMRSIRYQGYAKHKEIHDVFRDQTLVSLKKTLELSNYSQSAAERFLSVLLGWLTGHIMTEDQEITGERLTEEIYHDPTEVPAAAEVISQAMQNVFRIKAKLADSNYNGRSIGAAYYYRLCYDMDKGGKVQILMGAEERLIRRGVGLLCGFPAMQNTEMVKEVSLQILEQFLQYMSRLVESENQYQISKKELLTRDEFRADYMTRYPYSLLFETRLGYFAFCSRVWKPKRKKAGAE